MLPTQPRKLQFISIRGLRSDVKLAVARRMLFAEPSRARVDAIARRAENQVLSPSLQTIVRRRTDPWSRFVNVPGPDADLALRMIFAGILDVAEDGIITIDENQQI